MRSSPVSVEALDAVLTAQLAVAWAGEAGDPEGDDRRLGWWRTDLHSEFGGQDLFERLLPATWRWAMLQAAREAARRMDAAARAGVHDPDRLRTLFHLGPAVDAAVDDRLLDLKRHGRPPVEALPGLRAVLTDRWSQPAFADWLARHGSPEFSAVPAGRRLRTPPAAADRLAAALLAVLLPLPDRYPLPHAQVGA